MVSNDDSNGVCLDDLLFSLMVFFKLLSFMHAMALTMGPKPFGSLILLKLIYFNKATTNWKKNLYSFECQIKLGDFFSNLLSISEYMNFTNTSSFHKIILTFIIVKIGNV